MRIIDRLIGGILGYLFRGTERRIQAVVYATVRTRWEDWL